MMEDYLDIVYDKKQKPLTSYPEKLVSYIIKVCQLDSTSEASLLEPGVGRGEHLRIFKDKGFNVKGLDISKRSAEMSPDLDIDIMDSDGSKWPYPDDTFDVVYSKSFIEHLDYPEIYMKEAFRVLKPGGRIINLTPDWDAGYRKFYDDYTHKTPFTVVSIANITKVSGFESVNAFAFRQLPMTWNSPVTDFLCAVIGLFVPVRSSHNFFRWTRELMLMSYGTKPLTKWN